MKQAHDYRKYNVRLTSADWQRGSARVIISDRELPICWANRRDGVVRACINRTLYPSAIWSPLPEIVLDIDRGVTHIIVQ